MSHSLNRYTGRPRFAAATLAAMLGLLALVACETAPQDDAALSQARSAVARAEAEPNVAKYAPDELQRARNLLSGANNEEGGSGKSRITAHYAYLAMQMARIAEQRAREQVAMAHLQNDEGERQKILQAARLENVQASQTETLQAARTERGMVLTLDDGLFDTGRAELKPGAQRSIGQIVGFLNEHPERRVQIEGFTDDAGAADYNLELSQSRADAVAMAIIQRGIEAQRIRATGYGKRFPVASNSNAGSRQLNRRVEIIVSNDAQAIPVRQPGGAP